MPVHLYDDTAEDPAFDPWYREFPNSARAPEYYSSVAYCTGCGREFFTTDPRQTRCRPKCGKTARPDNRKGDRHEPKRYVAKRQREIIRHGKHVYR
jgi:hypothetical protein